MPICKTSIAQALRQLADQVDKFPEDATAEWIASGFVILQCRTVAEFRKAARALGLTLKDVIHGESCCIPGDHLSLERKVQFGPDEYSYFWVGVRIDKSLVATMQERPSVEKFYDVPDNLLGDDYEPPKALEKA